MGLNYEFRAAGRILAALSPEQHRRLEDLTAEIQTAEEVLRRRAARPLARCQNACRGLCCRNVALDEIIGRDDFVYLLIRAPSLKNRIAACLAEEKPFFTADCCFLEGGTGPCMFPPAVRPVVCLTTFCGDTAPIRQEIRRLKRAFGQLAWFLRLRHLPELRRFRPPGG